MIAIQRPSLVSSVRGTTAVEFAMVLPAFVMFLLGIISCGRICMYRKRVNISTVLAGQRLGIKQVDEGIWLVSFMRYDLGFIDLEQKTLQPLDNPFGPSLSPMS